MKKSNWKFFVIIGVLLLIAGIIVYPDDDIVGVIGVLIGSFNVFKGIQLARGVQPLIIRKQQERYKDRDKELEDELKDSKKKKR